MTLVELMDRVIKDGIQSVLDNETSPESREGGVAGFELCRGLFTANEFETLLRERRQVERNMQHAGEHWPNDPRSYWTYRYATLQVEWTYEILRVAMKMSPISARAVMKYQSILEAADGTVTS